MSPRSFLIILDEYKNKILDNFKNKITIGLRNKIIFD